MAQAIRPVMLVILDGFGWREETADNAVRLARTPAFTQLWQTCPHALLRTSGRDVGLPEGQMGNSEVGHLNIGAGRVVHPGAGADRRYGRRWHDRQGIGVHRAGRPAEGLGRHVPSDGPGLARRGALAPGPCRRAGEAVAGGRGADGAARLHRRARHAAAIRGGRPCPVGRRAAGGRADRHRLRPLLRHGSRQALGPRRQGLPGR